MPFLGFFDYNSSGKGIAKDEPEKKPFFKFWELFGRKFWKFFYINFVYLLFCLPIVTIGPATVALSQVMRKFTLEQPIFFFDEFYGAFKKNFKQGLIIGLIDIFFVVAFVFSLIYYFLLMEESPTLMNIALLSITIASGSFVLMMHFYIYPQIAALSLSLNQIVKNAFFLTVLGIKRNLVTLAVTVFFITLVVITEPFSILLLPIMPAAWLCFLSVFNSYPVIQKYIIDPYYKARGEKNPEMPDYSVAESQNNENGEVGDDNESDGKPLFEDFGGREAAYKAPRGKAKTQPGIKPKIKGKIIK